MVLHPEAPPDITLEVDPGKFVRIHTGLLKRHHLHPVGEEGEG